MRRASSIRGFRFRHREEFLRGLARWLGLVCAALGFSAAPLPAQSVQHLTTPQPGGMPGWPVLGGLEPLTNGVRIYWDGPSGYYQVFQKSNTLDASWVAVGPATNLQRYAVITRLYSNAFFRVAGPAPRYVGVKVCVTCHAGVCQYETNTPHAGAFAALPPGQQQNPSCLVCHTVGYGLPTGFVSASQTPQLEGVQCENCHGPAGRHAAAPDDPTVVPRVEIAATVCGGCHTGPMSPTYEEWNLSGHAAVVPDALQVMSAATNNIRSCGVCHSGSARLALMRGTDPAVKLAGDFDVPITCAVCHDPHSTNAGPAQLRGPVASTNQFHFLSSDVATVAAFTNKYAASANINLCAQCHNDRGASWTDTARAPHHSLQYNFLLGSVGELPDGTATFNPGSHAGLPSSAVHSLSGTFYLTNQCVACHMQPDAAPATTHSHAFAVNDNVCLNCHDPQAAEAALAPAISNQVATIILALNQWAALKAPAALRTNGVVAWEYTIPGGLTWQTNASGWVTGWSLQQSVPFTGPNAGGQALILTNFPDIAKARFDLYLVLNDGSFGIHNPAFALGLLNAAQNFVFEELFQ